MPLYAHVFIARQDISSAQVEGLVSSFTELLEKDGGKIVNTEYWGLKNLAYRIKKNRKGHYMMFNINGPSAAVQEFERNMRLSEDVLRYMTIRVDAFEEGPSLMVRNKGSRDDDRHRERPSGETRPSGAQEEAKEAKDQDKDQAATPEAAFYDRNRDGLCCFLIYDYGPRGPRDRRELCGYPGKLRRRPGHCELELPHVAIAMNCA